MQNRYLMYMPSTRGPQSPAVAHYWSVACSELDPRTVLCTTGRRMHTQLDLHERPVGTPTHVCAGPPLAQADSPPPAGLLRHQSWGTLCFTTEHPNIFWIGSMLSNGGMYLDG